MWPPTSSISRAMAAASRRRVPLNTMCSIRWARPFSAGVSCRVPTPTHRPTDADSTDGMASVTTVRPLSRRVTRIPIAAPGLRSEEHTSELQSLMRRSYAVLCLKKKNNDQLTQIELKVTHHIDDQPVKNHKNNASQNVINP